MPANPYRTSDGDRPRQLPIERGSYEIAVVALLVWALGVMRVACALARAEATCREVELAWILVLFAPIVVWREIAAARGR